MVRTDRITLAFFEMLKAGLWRKEVRFATNEAIDWEEIYRLASEQSVLGLILAGVEQIKSSSIQGFKMPPQELLLQMIGEVQMIEQRNRAMNEFVEELFEKMQVAGINAVLVKGQGIAQCYEKPEWRTSGDVDLLMDAENYERAKNLLIPIAETVDVEYTNRMHLGLIFGSFEVELHGTLHTSQFPKINKVSDIVQKETLDNHQVRIWKNGNVSVKLPEANNDVIFVFAHIVHHYFGGGIGLRQVCDWCRLLWCYRSELDILILEQRIRSMGMMKEWKALATLAVDYLGMPIEAMPFYESRYSNKGTCMLKYILHTGNLGHNRDNACFNSTTGKAWRYICDTPDHIKIFPMDSLMVMLRMIRYGVRGI